MWIAAQALYRPWGIMGSDGRPIQVHHGGHLRDLVPLVGDSIDVVVAGDPTGTSRFRVEFVEISEG